MREAFVQTLVDLAAERPEIELLIGDVGFGVLRPFAQRFADRMTNVGIAEQNMLSIAAGMAMCQKTVFVYSIGNFPTLRCLEQIRNDCAYHGANVKIVCVGGGLAYGALGMSHHATEDIAVMRALPGISVFAPGDAQEARAVTRAMADLPGTCYLRLGRGGEKRIHGALDGFSVGKAICVQEGARAAIFSTGAIFEEVMIACAWLEEMGVVPSVYTFPTVKPLDEETILRCAQRHELIVTCEEHRVIGGFGGAVAEVMAEHPSRAALLRIGLGDAYGALVGTQEELRGAYGIGGRQMAERIREKLAERERG